MSKYKVVIGRSEFIDFPGIVLHVPAKIDTGAFCSAIHCTSTKIVHKDGLDLLRVVLLGHPCSPVTYNMDFEEFRNVTVTNSFGQQEERYEVTLRTKIGPKVFRSQFTLADRSYVLFPVLIGRKSLTNRFLIDTMLGGVDRQKLKNEFSITTPIDEEDME